MTKEEMWAAHDLSSKHREQIEASEVCGCYYCMKLFAPSAIKEWVDHGQTALCPHCGIDSVIGSSQHELTCDFLPEMHDHWFG